MPLTLRSVAGFQASVVPLNTPHSSHKPFKEMGRRTSSRLKSQVATAHSAVSSDEPKAPLARPRARSQKKAPAAAEPTKAAGAGITSAGATPQKGAQTRVRALEAATRKRKINQDKDGGDQNESAENPTEDKTKQQKKDKPVKEKTVKEKVAKVIFGCHECQKYYPCPLRWPRLVGQIVAKLSGLSAKDVCLWRNLLRQKPDNLSALLVNVVNASPTHVQLTGDVPTARSRDGVCAVERGDSPFVRF